MMAAANNALDLLDIETMNRDEYLIMKTTRATTLISKNPKTLTEKIGHKQKLANNNTKEQVESVLLKVKDFFIDSTNNNKKRRFTEGNKAKIVTELRNILKKQKKSKFNLKS